MRKPAPLRIGGYAALLAVSGFALLPIFWMFSGSLKSGEELFQVPTPWLPAVPRFENYTVLFREMAFGSYLWNSVLTAGATTALNLLLSSMAGYSLAKFRYRGRGAAFWLVMITLLLPLQAAIVPLYLVVRDMGLLNTRAALILPFAATPFGIFLMRQYMLSLPDELLEAARIDGAGELRIFLRIVLPLSLPALAALGIFSFMFNWNNFLWPLVALDNRALFTLPLGIAMMQGEYATSFHQLMAAASFASLPVLLLYVFLQRHFTNSMVTSGIRG